MHHGQISKAIADGLLELRSRMEKGDIPSSKLDETLNLATWNAAPRSRVGDGVKSWLRLGNAANSNGWKSRPGNR